VHFYCLCNNSVRLLPLSRMRDFLVQKQVFMSPKHIAGTMLAAECIDALPGSPGSRPDPHSEGRAGR
jgi:hypothetical protein